MNVVLIRRRAMRTLCRRSHDSIECARKVDSLLDSGDGATKLNSHDCPQGARRFVPCTSLSMPDDGNNLSASGLYLLSSVNKGVIVRAPNVSPSVEHVLRLGS